MIITPTNDSNLNAWIGNIFLIELKKFQTTTNFKLNTKTGNKIYPLITLVKLYRMRIIY